MAETQLIDWRGGQQTLNSKKIALCDHYGPASYTQITPGTPPTGGDTISAKACGLNSIEQVICAGDSTGTYTLIAFPQKVTTAGPMGGTGADASVQCKWVTLTAGGLVETAGSTNLSAVSVRIMVIGN
jgi:hypothetical protein